MNTRPHPRRLGQDESCPHCGAKTGVSLASDGFGICLLCGGPRILVDAAIDRPGREKALLSLVKSFRMQRIAWAVGAAIGAGLGLVAATMALSAMALFDLGAFATVSFSVMVLVPAALAIFGFGKFKALSRERRETLEEARRVVASELYAAKPDLEPKDLARILHVSDDVAIELFAHAQVGTLLSDGIPPVRVRLGEAEMGDDDANVHTDASERSRRE